MNPHLALIGLVVGISLFLGGYWKGYADMTASCDLRISKMEAQSQKLKDAEAAKAHRESEKLEQADAEREIIYREIEREVVRIVERPVYRNTVCLDADGLRIANAALAGARPDPGEPDSGMSGTDRP